MINRIVKMIAILSCSSSNPNPNKTDSEHAPILTSVVRSLLVLAQKVSTAWGLCPLDHTLTPHLNHPGKAELRSTVRASLVKPIGSLRLLRKFDVCPPESRNHRKLCLRRTWTITLQTCPVQPRQQSTWLSGKNLHSPRKLDMSVLALTWSPKSFFSF